MNRAADPVVLIYTGSRAAGPAVADLAARLLADRPALTLVVASGELAQAAWQDLENDAELVAPPIDTPAEVRRFLDRWQPGAALWLSFDLPRFLLREAAARGVPLYLADCGAPRPLPRRIAPARGTTAANLARFDRLLAGDPAGAAVLARFGVQPDRIEVAGMLEHTPPALPCNETDRAALAAGAAGRPIWLAAGVEAGEEAAVLAAHRAALFRAHRLLLVLVPVDPGTGPELAARLQAEGWAVATRSAGAEPGRDTQVYIADTEEEMGLWYRLAPISFLGGSLAGGGAGLDPMAAAALGSAVLHGPHAGGHGDAYARLSAAGAARQVRTADELGAAVELLLSPSATAAMARAAWDVASSGAAVMDRVARLVLVALDKPAG